MSDPVCAALSVGLPESYASAIEDPYSEVQAAVQHHLVRWGVKCRPHPEIRSGDALSLTIDGHEVHAPLADYMADLVTETAETVALTADRLSHGWMLGTWVKLVLSVAPDLVLTDELCRDLWVRQFSHQVGERMPAWFPELVRRLGRLGVPAPEPGALRALVERMPAGSLDPQQLTEIVLDGQLRPVQVVASGATFDDLARSMHAGRSDFEHQLIRALGVLGILTPAVTMARDASVAPGTCEIWLGGLMLAVSAVPPAGSLLAMVSSDLLTEEGVIAPVSLGFPGAGWTLVRQQSPAGIEAIQRFACEETDYLVGALGQALTLLPERLPDRRCAERLLGELYDHVGSGHTVWFTRQSLSTDHVVIVLRRMLAADLPLNDLPALLRELLAVIDLSRPSHPDFTESLDRALARRTRLMKDIGARV